MKKPTPYDAIDHYESYKIATHLSWHKKISKYLLIWFIIIKIFFILLPWRQTTFGKGRVIARSPNERQQSIDAPIDGRILQWHVLDGSYVKKGDPVVTISDNDPLLMQRLEDEQQSVVDKLKALRLSLKTSQINVSRQYTLVQEGIASRRVLELARLEEAKFKSDVATSQAELLRIQTRLARQKNQNVTAPCAGSIFRRKSGETSVLVKLGESLATIIPDTKSQVVELIVDGNFISLLQKGQKARLQFEGWPALQFSGWPNLAIGTFGAVLTLIDAADDGHGNFRLLLEPDPQDASWPNEKYLRQGVRAHGWILLGVVPLGYEIWRTINNFPPSIEVSAQDRLEKETKK